MSSESNRFSRTARQSAALASLLTALLLFPLAAMGAQEGGTCGGEASTSEPARDTVPATRPGPWRHEAKRKSPTERTPGTRTVAPVAPLATDAATQGRWVPGYRPATAGAQAAFEAWKAAQAAKVGTAEGVRVANGPSSNHAANLLSGKRADHVDDEPIVRTVHQETYPTSQVDLRRVGPVEDSRKPKAEAADEPEAETGYHHLSGMTWDEYLWIKKQAESAPPTVGGQVANAWSALAPPFAGVGFDAIGSNGTSTPPDPIMAAGPSHLIAIVNRRYGVWNKTGTPLVADIPLDQFFSGVQHCSGVFDVFVDYDEANDRFVLGGEALESASGTDSYLCVAATATNDPTGIWNRAAFRADSARPDTWIDYPHMGIGLDAIYITGNMFLDGGGYDHIRAYAVDKNALYNGTAVTVAEADFGSLFFTAQPVKLHGFSSGGWPAPGTPHHLISHDSGGNSRIWRWSNPFQSDPVIYGTLAEAAFGGNPPSANELGAVAGGFNDTGSAKWLDAEYRHGKLWATRAVACNLGGGAGESCIDWIQVDVSGPAPVLEQQQSGGAYGGANEFRYYPDLSVDRNDNIAIGYTKSSATAYTQVWITGRESSDPAGTLQPEILRRAGQGNYFDGYGCQGGCDRWGDYTGMTVDPDGCTFWYLGEYSDGGFFNWGTHIGSFKFDSCSTSSLLQVDKGTYTCNDAMTITVTDSVPVDAATVSTRTTISTSVGDVETIPAGSWTGSDCAGAFCGTWNATRPVSGNPGSGGDGTLNVGNGGTISLLYADPHAGHGDRSRVVAVNCTTRFEDGGYLIAGGCAPGQGAESYRDYMDGGEFVSYTFGIYNPPTASRLTDVQAELVVSGPAANKVTVFNPTIHIGALDPGTLTAPVFSIYIDPSIDAAGLRMSGHDFNLRITSGADGFTSPQIVTQRQMLQTDDNIVSESQCWNFESGSQGFVESALQYSYTCQAGVCGTQTQVSTVAAPWALGPGCGSETRTDDPGASCDTAGANAFKSNPNPAACGNFTQTRSGGLGTVVDTALYSPIFGPAHTGLAANGQPWSYEWNHAQWYYRSDMKSGANPALAAGFLWDANYLGSAVPAVNEIYDYYPYFTGYFTYVNKGWDSATPWSSQQPPANLDSVSFATAKGLATPGLQWRWAVEVYDPDLGGDPLHTPATAGLALDNLTLAYTEYHAAEQLGSCVDPAPVVSFDQYSYLQCPGDLLGISVLDGIAGGLVRVTVTSDGTLDSETFSILGTGPRFAGSLPYSTAGGPRANDGTLLVSPSDRVRVTYTAATGASSQASAMIDCTGGDVIADGVAGLSDNGDHDSYADTNEVVNLSIRLRNNTSQPLHNVVAVIDSDDPTVDCISKGTAAFGTIAAGQTATNSLLADPFTFKVSGTASCTDPLAAPTARFKVLIRADGFAGPAEPQELTLLLDLNDLPGIVTFAEEFTGGPGGFVHQLGPGDDNGVAVNPDGYPCSPYSDEFFWRATGGNTGGGYFCWQDPAAVFPNGNYGDLNDSALYSPFFKIGATDTTLSFDHEYRFGWSGSYRVDGARVDYRLNGGPWRKLTTLPYDGPLIFNTYCNPLCNGAELAKPCFSETAGNGENIFNQLDQGTVNWRPVAGGLTGLTPGDLVQFRWRVGSMRSSDYGISTLGGYGVDNVRATNVVQQACDSAVHPDVGCGVVFGGFGNLAQICGDGDAVVEPTERWSVDVTLRNSTAVNAVNAVADLVVSDGSTILATVAGNPGGYGTLAAAGGTGTAAYEFVVESGAACLKDILFDLRNIADNQAVYGDQPSAFAVAVGGTGAVQAASQSVDPLLVVQGAVSSPLSPALGVPTPTQSVTLDYDSTYTNIVPVEAGSQLVDPLAAENTSVTTTLGAPFLISAGAAASAVVNWTSLIHENVTSCARVFLQTPTGATWTLKAIGSPAANPYNVLTVYQNANGGPGQYRIGVAEVQSGSCRNAATLSGATMTVTGLAPTGSWTANAKVSLWDGTSQNVLKNYGEADGAPYDLRALYDAAGPGSYALRLEENGGGGQARISAATLSVTGIECDAGCGVVSPPAPPVADGTHGAAMTLGRGTAPGDLRITIDNATCSSARAVVLYGNIGNYGAYQGAVGGCDIGTGPTATITPPGNSVWFNVIWVNPAGAAGHPGFGSPGPRNWGAAGLCGVVADDPSDAVCN